MVRRPRQLFVPPSRPAHAGEIVELLRCKNYTCKLAGNAPNNNNNNNNNDQGTGGPTNNNGSQGGGTQGRGGTGNNNICRGNGDDDDDDSNDSGGSSSGTKDLWQGLSQLNITPSKYDPPEYWASRWERKQQSLVLQSKKQQSQQQQLLHKKQSLISTSKQQQSNNHLNSSRQLWTNANYLGKFPKFYNLLEKLNWSTSTTSSSSIWSISQEITNKIKSESELLPPIEELFEKSIISSVQLLRSHS